MCLVHTLQGGHYLLNGNRSCGLGHASQPALNSAEQYLAAAAASKLTGMCALGRVEALKDGIRTGLLGRAKKKTG